MTLANIRSFYRDRASLFWTLAFPIIFVVLFGSIFSGGSANFTVGWVDQKAGKVHVPIDRAIKDYIADAQAKGGRP